MFAAGQLAHPSCPWHVSQLLGPLSSLDNCCPTGPQKVGCTCAVCGRGDCGPQLSCPSAISVLCDQRRKKLHVISKSVCLYCFSLFFLETELSSPGVEMIYRNATSQPSDHVIAEDVCSRGRTPWMFSERKSRLSRHFIFFSY